MNLIKCLKSFKFAFNGIKLVLGENNTRFHLLATGLAIISGFLVHLTINEWLWIVSAISIVWIGEAINTALERLTNLVSPDYHPLAGQVKDLAAGAVLIAAVYALLVGLLVFVPKLYCLYYTCSISC